MGGGGWFTPPRILKFCWEGLIRPLNLAYESLLSGEKIHPCKLLELIYPFLPLPKFSFNVGGFWTPLGSPNFAEHGSYGALLLHAWLLCGFEKKSSLHIEFGSFFSFCLTPCLFHTIFVSHPFCPTPIWSHSFVLVGQKGCGTKRVSTNWVLGQKGCWPIVCWDIRCVDKLIWDKLCVCPLRSSKGL